MAEEILADENAQLSNFDEKDIFSSSVWSPNPSGKNQYPSCRMLQSLTSQTSLIYRHFSKTGWPRITRYYLQIWPSRYQGSKTHPRYAPSRIWNWSDQVNTYLLCIKVSTYTLLLYSPVSAQYLAVVETITLRAVIKQRRNYPRQQNVSLSWTN